MCFSMKIHKNHILGCIFKQESIKIVFIGALGSPGWALGGPWALGTLGPWGPLALGTLGLGDPWALGTLGPWGPWALGTLGPLGPAGALGARIS